MTTARTVSLAEHVEERERVRRQNRVVRGTCAVLAIACVCLAGGVVFPSIHEQRKDLQLINEKVYFGEMPPTVTLPAAMLSTFRGLAVHVLWARSEELKEDGKYYELQQLSDWICHLQPRFPKVWENAAWNMSYNISVGTFTARERWHWVSAGANLLRDKGLVFNPRVINIYYELAWIYLHKMGDFMDDHHWGYKRNVAVEMERTLGQPPVDVVGNEATEAIRVIAEAAAAIAALGPVDSEDMLQVYIDRDQEKPSMGEVVSELDTIGFKPDARWLEFVSRHARRDLAVADLFIGTEKDLRLQRFRKIMNDEKSAAARDRLLAAVRAHVLRKDHKLDAEFMLEIMERYGAFDWRSVYAHGMYWAALGVRECAGSIGLDENVEMNTNRYMQFAIKDSFERGRVVLEPDYEDPFASFIELLPDTGLVDAFHKLILDQADRLRDGEDVATYYKEGPAGRLYKSGHVNFLHQAVRTLFLEGRREKSKFYYTYLRENYKEPDGSTKEMYLQVIDDFVMQDYLEDIDSFKTGPVIMNTFLQGFYANLAYERPQAAMVRYQFANHAYKTYMKSKQIDPNERRKLPPWPEMLSGNLERFILNYRRFGALSREVMLKRRVWKTLDNMSKDDSNHIMRTVLLETYRDIERQFRPEMLEHDPPLDFDKAFPEPMGLAEYEARKREAGQATDPKTVDEIEIKEGSKR